MAKHQTAHNDDHQARPLWRRRVERALAVVAQLIDWIGRLLVLRSLVELL